MSDRSNSHFKTGKSVFPCGRCHKRTRDTGNSERSLNMCKACIIESETENSHFDGVHDGAPEPTCSLCQKAGH